MLQSITQRLLLSVLMLGIVMVTGASAKTYSYTGPCPDGGIWLVVVTINDQGQVTGREGVNCLGDHWTDHCSIHVISPSGLPSTSDFYLTNDTGTAWIRFNVSAGSVTRMWGKTATGVYWEADADQPDLL